MFESFDASGRSVLARAIARGEATTGEVGVRELLGSIAAGDDDAASRLGPLAASLGDRSEGGLGQSGSGVEFTPAARQILSSAESWAEDRGTRATSSDLLLALLEQCDPDLRALLRAAGLDPNGLKSDLLHHVGRGRPSKPQLIPVDGLEPWSSRSSQLTVVPRVRPIGASVRKSRAHLVLDRVLRGGGAVWVRNRSVSVTNSWKSKRGAVED